MARGKIDPPNLDDRTWQDLVDQAKALIPHYAPEWTDHNPSDLGITLIELFAWLVEQMIYRLNRVPERNYIAFLNLLGITRDPATPASTWVTFKVSGEEPVTVHKESRVSTQPTTPSEAPVIFETDEDLEVIPANLVAAFCTDRTNRLAAVPPGLASVRLTLPAGATSNQSSSRIVLGFEGKLDQSIKLLVRLTQALPAGSEAATAWEYYAKVDNGTQWKSLKDNVVDQTDGFTRNGQVALTRPNDWDLQKLDEAGNKECHWAQVKLGNSGNADLELELEHLLFNSVAATHALTIKKEHLGSSDGTPYQHFELRHQPLYKQPGRQPYIDLVVEVKESEETGWEKWKCKEDLPAEVGCFYRLDPVTGTIMLGDGQHGKIPPAGSEIRAAYRCVAGGARSNVKAGAITVLIPDLTRAGIVNVENLVAAKGGRDEESVEEAKRRAPELLRIRNRAVTLEDYEYLARESSTQVKKVRALGPDVEMNGFGGLDRGPNTVTVIIIPDEPGSEQPLPSEELILDTQRYLDDRRPLTSHLLVTGPRYLPINVTVGVNYWRDAAQKMRISVEDLQKRIKEKIAKFLHPLTGGLENRGWQVGQNVMAADLLQEIQAEIDPATGFVVSLTLEAGTLGMRPKKLGQSSSASFWVKLADYEIACSGQHEVNADEIS